MQLRLSQGRMVVFLASLGELSLKRCVKTSIAQVEFGKSEFVYAEYERDRICRTKKRIEKRIPANGLGESGRLKVELEPAKIVDCQQGQKSSIADI